MLCKKRAERGGGGESTLWQWVRGMEPCRSAAEAFGVFDGGVMMMREGGGWRTKASRLRGWKESTVGSGEG